MELQKLETKDKTVEVNLKFKNINLETFLLIGQIDNLNLINNLKQKVKEYTKNSDLNYKTNVKGLFSGFNSLNKDKDFEDFIILIGKSIKLICQSNFRIIDSWGNILKLNDEVISHNHIETSLFCGILYLTEGGPGTYFDEYNTTVEEKIGRFVLFSPILKHSVKKIDKNIERITVAFNMGTVKFWDEDKTERIIL
jgi:hypothetical protein